MLLFLSGEIARPSSLEQKIMVGAVKRYSKPAFQFVAFSALILLSLLVHFSEPSFAQNSSNQGTLNQCVAADNYCGCSSCSCKPNCGHSACPPGRSLYDDYCIPDCPPNFIRYPGYPGVCLPPFTFGCPEGFDQVPLPQCPAYHVRDLNNPDQCVPDYGRIRNADQCPEMMEYASETGRCEFKCANGQFRDSNGLCQSFYGRDCPGSLVRDPQTGRCLPPGVWPPGYEWICLPKCPQGWARDLKRPTICLPPIEKCPDGSVTENGRCIPPCEPGTQRDRYGYCVPPACPEGSYVDLRGRCIPTDCPTDTRRNQYGLCEPLNDCPSGSTLIRGRCQPIEQGCIKGEEEVNGQCVPECKRGERRDANGRCVPEQQGCRTGTEPFGGRCVEICEPGTKRNLDGRCVPTQQKCLDGFRLQDGRCAPIKTQIPCRQGYQPDGEGGCERIIPLIPRICDKDEVFNKRTQRCEPARQTRPSTTYESNEGLPQLIPLTRDKPQLNQQLDCPKGYIRDKAGSCVRQ